MRPLPKFRTILGLSVLLTVAMFAVIIGVGALVHATGRGVALGIAIAALVAQIGTCLALVVFLLRAAGAEDANDRARRYPFRSRAAIMLGSPILLLAARPWGMVTVAIAGIAWLACHFILVAGSIMLHSRRRSLGSRPSAS